MFDFATKKAIVTDDNQASLAYIGILLKRMGFAVLPAENGFEVLRILKVVTPDVILVDIGMQPIDGLTILKEIKKNNLTASIPVIIATGDSSREMIKKCMKSECAAYLTKPVKVDKLHEAIEKCVFSSTRSNRKHLRASFNKKCWYIIREPHMNSILRTSLKGVFM
ncbi:MAG: response regulator [Nitrospirota bacterium]